MGLPSSAMAMCTVFNTGLVKNDINKYEAQAYSGYIQMITSEQALEYTHETLYYNIPVSITLRGLLSPTTYSYGPSFSHLDQRVVCQGFDEFERQWGQYKHCSMHTRMLTTVVA